MCRQRNCACHWLARPWLLSCMFRLQTGTLPTAFTCAARAVGTATRLENRCYHLYCTLAHASQPVLQGGLEATPGCTLMGTNTPAQQSHMAGVQLQQTPSLVLACPHRRCTPWLNNTIASIHACSMLAPSCTQGHSTDYTACMSRCIHAAYLAHACTHGHCVLEIDL